MREPSRRVIVVLGYSKRGATRLDPVCRARLERAAQIATPDDIVVLSGWSRDGRASPEAELMKEAWCGTAAKVVVDPDARTTAENAVNARDDIIGSDAQDVILVTSAWHAGRARAAFRLALLGRGVHVAAASPPGSGDGRTRARELALWPLLPFQILAARRRVRRSAEPDIARPDMTDL